MDAGSLTVVGTGFGTGHITAEASEAISSSQKVLFLVPHASTRDWIRAANPTSEALDAFYLGRASRLETYRDITEHILSFVRRGLRVCAVFYGHPGVFVFPSHEAIIRARHEGFAARMLPGVSAEDCLFADLGVDPGRRGCLTLDATDFLVRPRRLDVTVPLILWQVGAVGRTDYPSDDNRRNLRILSDVLQSQYGPRHEVVIYEAPGEPSCDALITCIRLQDLADTPVRLTSTLYVPPREDALIDQEMAGRLGMPESLLPNRKDGMSCYDPFRPYGRPKSGLPHRG